MESISTSYQPVKPFRMYEGIVTQIEAMVESGELKPGDRLPSERQLSERLRVSRSTLTQALRILESDGIVIARQGSGRYIRHSTPDYTTDSIIGNLQQAAIADLLEVREVIEKRVCELACERATASDLALIERNVNDSSDVAFHVSIALSTHNPIFVNIMKSSMKLLYKTREYTLLTDRAPEDIVDEHRQIYTAIKNKNSEKAVNLIMKHFNSIKLRLKVNQ